MVSSTRRVSHQQRSKPLEQHIACPCGKSSDAYCTYDDGHGHCFSCNKTYFNKDIDEGDIEEKDGEVNEPENAEYRYYSHRGLSEKTFEFYNVHTQFVNGEPTKLGFVYPNKAVKFRSLLEKKFNSVGPMSEAGLFGKDKYDPGSRESITITEGEYDALSTHEITRDRTAAVSVRSASSARTDCIRDWDYINSFSKIYLAFDNDEPGQSAARSVASLFDYQKVYHVKFDKYKDANEYLVNGEADNFLSSWKAAKRYAPEAIISTMKEFKQKLTEAREDILGTYPFQTLTNALYGLRRGSVTVFKGLEGIGKTEIFRAMEYHLLTTTKMNIGILHLEEDNATTLKSLAGYHLKAPAALPDSGVSNDDILKAIAELDGPNEDRIHIHSSFDVEDESSVLDNIRFLASAASCDVIFLDHISWLATGGGDDDDERRKLDRISQRLKLLAKELRIAIVLISHVNDAGQTRGSRNITKSADTVIHLSRNITSNDSNERSRLYFNIEKARLARATGPVGSAVFEPETGTLVEHLVDQQGIKMPSLA